jgi:Sec-independent protein translocase protein TatA
MSDAAVVTVCGAAVTIVANVVTFLILWVKLKYGTDKAKEAADKAGEAVKKAKESAETVRTKMDSVMSKVDHNTKIATESKVTNEEMVETVKQKLNGGIDAVIATALEPIHKLVTDHKAEVAEKIEMLNKYVHQRNHDILDAVNSSNLKIEVVRKMLEDQPRTK